MSENLLRAWAFAQLNDLDNLQNLVPSEVDPNESTGSEENHMHTLLMCAAAHGALDCTKYLIKSGAIVDKKNFMGYTALHWTAFTGRTEAIDFLLQKGADINARTEDGRTILHIASARGHVQYVQYILDLLENSHKEKADNDNEGNRKKTPTKEQLLNACSSSGWNALFFAVAANQRRVAQFLVEQGIETSSPDINLKTPSSIAKQVKCAWFKHVVNVEDDDADENDNSDHNEDGYVEEEEEDKQSKKSPKNSPKTKTSSKIKKALKAAKDAIMSESDSEDEQTVSKSSKSRTPTKSGK